MNYKEVEMRLMKKLSKIRRLNKKRIFMIKVREIVNNNKLRSENNMKFILL